MVSVAVRMVSQGVCNMVSAAVRQCVSARDRV